MVVDLREKKKKNTVLKETCYINSRLYLELGAELSCLYNQSFVKVVRCTILGLLVFSAKLHKR